MIKLPSRPVMLLRLLGIVSLVLIFSNALAADLSCPCKVVKITDGDTIYVLDNSQTRHKIRLGGIDAPEKKQAFGKKSTKNLAGLISGVYVRVESDKKDHYGRVIGKVILDGVDINLQQIKMGYAWHYKHYQRDQTVADRLAYSEAEVAARLSRVGFWYDSKVIPPWVWRKSH